MNTAKLKSFLSNLEPKWTPCPFTALEVQMVAREIGVVVLTRRNSTGTLEVKRK